MASRPGTGAVTTIAVLHFVGGGLGLLYSMCEVLSVLSAVGGGDPQAQAMIGQIPGFLPYRIGTVAISLIFDVLLIVLGVGLLKRWTWARWGSVTYGVLSILMKAGTSLYLFVFVNPVAARFMIQDAPPAQKQQMQQIADLALTVNAVLPLVLMVYPAVVILVMLLPSVGRYFQPDSRRDRDDYDDDDRRDWRRDRDWDRDEDDAPRGGSTIDRSGQIYREDDGDRNSRRRWGDEEEDDRRGRRWRDDDR